MLTLSTDNYWADLLAQQIACKHERRKGLWIGGVGIEQCLDCGRALAEEYVLGKGHDEGEGFSLSSPSVPLERCRFVAGPVRLSPGECDVCGHEGQDVFVCFQCLQALCPAHYDEHQNEAAV